MSRHLHHRQVRVISRDRAGAYADGARRGAPNAVQVADGWHLLRNLADALERLFDRQPASLRAATALVPMPESAPAPKAALQPGNQLPNAAPADIMLPTRAEERRQARRAKRLERYESVRRLHRQGASHRTIARQLKMGKGTVRRYLHASAFPEIAQRPKAPSILDPFLPYLMERWQAGGHNGVQLWREVSQHGYTGSRPEPPGRTVPKE